MVDLSKFQQGSVLDGTLRLFDSLWIKIYTPSGLPTPLEQILQASGMPVAQIPQYVLNVNKKISSFYFVGVLDSNALKGQREALEFKEEVDKIGSDYQGLLVFGMEVPEEESLTRSEISALTRLLNRLSKSAPVALVVKRGDYVSFAMCERTPWAQVDKKGEKPGKVSLLRNIYVPKPHRGHIDILDRMALGNVRTFDALYKQWLDVFNSDKLTNRFYTELQNWFFWAVKNVSFPNDIADSTDNEKYNNENVIRLITRLMFVWFLKEKGLVPTEIFKPKYLSGILRDFDPLSEESSLYYRAILQNLFFGTLNKQVSERKFAFDEGWAKNRSTHGIRNIYRFEDSFVWWDKGKPEESRRKVEEQVLQLFNHVPYLNNSLFECLDDKKQKGKTYYWDGFSRCAKKQAKVPNHLFFAKEETADLSEFYIDPSEKPKESELKKYRNVKVHGILDILSRYTFTIEENTPLDVDVALDPELLGKVFENLLAAYNPETKKTARKSTGSYYTPRPIVQYMVDESIVAYLQKAVPSVEESKLRQMLAYDDKELDFELGEADRKAMVEAIFKCRMLDPACGSGAFPMGILQQLSHLLSRIDTKNAYWEEIVMNRAMADVEFASRMDVESKEKEIENIKKVFNMSVEYPDYARKLYLIENCIYGVDIQSIAVQISRLRFFISLICEQQPIDDASKNFGINPLPNLELKFVAANTLVPLANAEKTYSLFEDEEIKTRIKELRQTRHSLFAVTSASSRKRNLEKDERLRREIAELSADKFTEERESKIQEKEKLLVETEEKLRFTQENAIDRVEIIENQNLFGETKETIRVSSKEREVKNLQSQISFIKSEIKRLRDTAQSGRESTLALARQLTEWNPFDQNVSSPFFDPDWMFGIKDGFDIVIGNPPYVLLPKEEYLRLYSIFYTHQEGKIDLYRLFIERVISTLLSVEGILSFITPNTFLTIPSCKALRRFILNNGSYRNISSYDDDVFDTASVNNVVFAFQKDVNIQNTQIRRVSIQGAQSFYKNCFSSLEEDNAILNIFIDKEASSLIEKIEGVGQKLGTIECISMCLGIQPYHNSIHTKEQMKTKFLHSPVQLNDNYVLENGGRNILYYDINPAIDKWVDYSKEFYMKPDFKFFSGPRIVLREITGETLTATFLENDMVFNKSVYNIIHSSNDSSYLLFLLGILNSKVIGYYVGKKGEKSDQNLFPRITMRTLKNLPIPPYDEAIAQSVGRALLFKRNKEPRFENEINLIEIKVGEVFNLTYKDYKTIVPNSPISREEYESGCIL